MNTSSEYHIADKRKIGWPAKTMQPTSPVIKAVDPAEEINLAQNQPEYIPLPMLRINDTDDPATSMLTRWTFSPEERAKIAAGADLHLFIMGTRHPPVILQLTED